MVRRFILPATLRSYQTDLIRDDSDEVVCVSSTQVGKTHAYANKLVAKMWEYRGPNAWWWCAPTYQQSKAAQRAMYEVTASAGIRASGPRPPFKQNPPPPLVLINGSTCEYRTWDNPDHLMGDPIAGAVIDEGGLLPTSAFTAISSRRSFTLGPLWWIGNPGMATGQFRKACARAKRNNTLHHWTWRTLHKWYQQTDPQQAAKYLAFIESERDIWPEFEFRRLYEAEWTSDESAVFRNLDECVHGTDLLDDDADDFVLGVDVAQLVDYLAVVSYGINTGRIEERDRFRGIGYPQAAERIKAHQDRLGALVVVEINGPGIALVQEFDRIGVNYLTFTTTSRSKQEIILALAADTQHNRVTIADVGALPHELACYRYTRTATGYKYSAPEGEHDDTVMGAALARWGATRYQGKTSEYGWIS